MAALPAVMVATTFLAGVGAYFMSSKNDLEHDGIPTSSGIINRGTIVKLRDDSKELYKKSCLMDPGYSDKGTVIELDPIKKSVKVRCRGTKGAISEEFPASALEILFSTFGSRGIPIMGGIAVPGAIVKMKNVVKKAGAEKALSNPFFENTGKVVSVLAQGGDQELLVKVERLDKGQNKEQYYAASELELVSSPEDANAGVGAAKGMITIGTNVKLKENVVFKNGGKHLAQSDFEKVGKVTAVRVNVKDTSKVDVVVSTRAKDKKFIGEDIYDRDDLEVVPKDKAPRGGVAVFGGMAVVDVKVKVREERKLKVSSKPLGRSAFGDVGTVTKLDPQSADNLKVFVTCNGLNPEEQTGDWYEPEDLEIAEPESEEGIPIFGGRATVGAFVAATEETKGRKCLGKTQYGDVGIIKGIDPNGENDLKINVVCGKDKNGKQSEWYMPTELRLYVPAEEVEDSNVGDAASKESLAREKVARLQLQLSLVEKDMKAVDESAETLDRAKAELDAKQEAYTKVMKDGTTKQKRIANEELNAAKQWYNGANSAAFAKQKTVDYLRGKVSKSDIKGEYYFKLTEKKDEIKKELELAKTELQTAQVNLEQARKSSKSFQKIEEAYNSAKRNLELANIMKAQVYGLYSEIEKEGSCDIQAIGQINQYKLNTNRVISSWRSIVTENGLKNELRYDISNLKRIQNSDMYLSILKRIKTYADKITKLVINEEDKNKELILNYTNKIIYETKLQEYIDTINNETDIFGEETYDKLDPIVLEVYTKRNVFDNSKTSQLKSYLVSIDEEFEKLRDITRDIEIAGYLGDTPIESLIKKFTRNLDTIKNEQKGAEEKLKTAIEAHEQQFLKESQYRQQIFIAQENLKKFLETKSKGPTAKTLDCEQSLTNKLKTNEKDAGEITEKRYYQLIDAFQKEGFSKTDLDECIRNKEIRTVRDFDKDEETKQFFESHVTGIEKGTKEITKAEYDNLRESAKASGISNFRFDNYFYGHHFKYVKSNTRHSAVDDIIPTDTKTGGAADEGVNDKIKDISDAYNKYSKARLETLKAEKEEKIANGKVTCLTQLINSGQETLTKLTEDLKKRCKVVEMSEELNNKFEELINLRKQAFTAAQIAKDPCRGRDYNNIKDLTDQIKKVKENPTKKSLESFLKYLEDFNENENVVQINTKIEEIKKFIEDLKKVNEEETPTGGYNYFIGGGNVNTAVDYVLKNMSENLKGQRIIFSNKTYITPPSVRGLTNEEKALRDNIGNVETSYPILLEFVNNLNAVETTNSLTPYERTQVFTKIFGKSPYLVEMPGYYVNAVNYSKHGIVPPAQYDKNEKAIQPRVMKQSITTELVPNPLKQNQLFPGNTSNKPNTNSNKKPESNIQDVFNPPPKQQENQPNTGEIQIPGTVPEEDNNRKIPVDSNIVTDPIKNPNVVGKLHGDFDSQYQLKDNAEAEDKVEETPAPATGDDGIIGTLGKSVSDLLGLSTPAPAPAPAPGEPTPTPTTTENKDEEKEENKVEETPTPTPTVDENKEVVPPGTRTGPTRNLNNVKNVLDARRRSSSTGIGASAAENKVKNLEADAEAANQAATDAKYEADAAAKAKAEADAAARKAAAAANQAATDAKKATTAQTNAETEVKKATDENARLEAEQKAQAAAQAATDAQTKSDAAAQAATDAKANAKAAAEAKAQADAESRKAAAAAKDANQKVLQAKKEQKEAEEKQNNAKNTEEVAALKEATKGANEAEQAFWKSWEALKETVDAVMEVDVTKATNAENVVKELGQTAAKAVESVKNVKLAEDATELTKTQLKEYVEKATKSLEKTEELVKKVSENLKKTKERETQLSKKVSETENLVNLVYQCQTSGGDIILNTVFRLTSEADSKIRDVKEQIEEVETIIRETSGLNDDAQRKVNKFSDEAKVIDKCYNSEKERAEARYKAEKEKVDKSLEEFKAKLFEVKQQNQQNNSGKQKKVGDLSLDELRSEKKTLTETIKELEDEDKNEPLKGEKKGQLNTARQRLKSVNDRLEKEDKNKKTGGKHRVTRRRPRY